MDYRAVRGIFFAEPEQVAPTPRAVTTGTPARRLRDAIEPLACQSIWSEEAADERLRGRGLVAGSILSEEGLRFRDRLEAQTDAMQQSIIDAVGPHLESHIKRLDAWSNTLVAAGGATPDPAKRAAG